MNARETLSELFGELLHLTYKRSYTVKHFGAGLIKISKDIKQLLKFYIDQKWLQENHHYEY